MSQFHKEQISLAERMEKRGREAVGEISVFSARTKYEDSIHAYETAGNCYVAVGKWRKAGDMYASCAESAVSRPCAPSYPAPALQ